MQAESPVAQFASMSINQADEELVEFVATPGDNEDDISVIGSSVSQDKRTTMEVDAAMINNAVALINNLSEQVLIYYCFSVSTSNHL
jgi:hypothetical protein